MLAALSVDADHVAFVGSRRKAEVLKKAMAERGVAPERLAKLKAPAGLDLGTITPDEIAISILAEIVATRRGKNSRGLPPVGGEADPGNKGKIEHSRTCKASFCETILKFPRACPVHYSHRITAVASISTSASGSTKLLTSTSAIAG